MKGSWVISNSVIGSVAGAKKKEKKELASVAFFLFSLLFPSFMVIALNFLHAFLHLPAFARLRLVEHIV